MQPEQQRLISEEQFIKPLINVLNKVTPSPKPSNTPIEKSPTLKKSLNDLFPEQAYDEKDIQIAKKELGAITNVFTQEQLRDAVSEIQFLTETWLDDFEREIFGGLTLKETLHEKGGL